MAFLFQTGFAGQVFAKPVDTIWPGNWRSPQKYFKTPIKK